MTRGLRTLAGIVAVLCLTATCRARDARADDAIDRYIRAQMQQQHIPGLSIAVVKSGKIVKARGYGVESLEQGTPASPQTVYRLASVTKQFTASAIMLLVQDGRLGLDDRISRYLDPSPAAWSDITIRELLSHTAGLKDYINELHVGTCNGTTEEELVKNLGEVPLGFKPGTAQAYSNTSYLVLGLIVRKITGQSYDQFLRSRIFQPLGMDQTMRSDTEAIVPHRAGAYQWIDGKLRNAPVLPPSIYSNADAGLVSSVADLARWDAALHDGKILTPASQAIMFQSARLPDNSEVHYGFGWNIGAANGPKYVSHSGSLVGTSTYIVRFLDRKLTVIVLANRSDVSASNIGRHIAALVDPTVSARHASSTPTDPAVTATITTVLEGIQNKTLRDDVFAPTMWKNGDRDQTLAYLRNLFASYGMFHSVAFLSVSHEETKRQYFCEATFGDNQIIVDFTLDPDGRISAMGVSPE